MKHKSIVTIIIVNMFVLATLTAAFIGMRVDTTNIKRDIQEIKSNVNFIATAEDIDLGDEIVVGEIENWFCPICGSILGYDVQYKYTEIDTWFYCYDCYMRYCETWKPIISSSDRDMVEASCISEMKELYIQNYGDPVEIEKKFRR